MKYIKTPIAILVTVCGFLYIASCKQKTQNAEAVEAAEIVIGAEEGTEEVERETFKDCDDFIDQYEAWSEEYIAFMSKYKDNPVEAVTSPEYQEMMLKASSWSQDWLAISVSCAQNSKYEERVTEISDRMEEKMKELGFN